MFMQSTSSKWFLSEAGWHAGPLSAERIELLLRWGKVSSRAFVCDECGSAWIPIRHSMFGRFLKKDAPGPTRDAQGDHRTEVFFGVVACALALVAAAAFA